MEAIHKEMALIKETNSNEDQLKMDENNIVPTELLKNLSMRLNVITKE